MFDASTAEESPPHTEAPCASGCPPTAKSLMGTISGHALQQLPSLPTTKVRMAACKPQRLALIPCSNISAMLLQDILTA